MWPSEFRLAAAALAGTAALSSGCAIVSPVPAIELLKAAGGAARHALANAAVPARDTVSRGPLRVSTLCIEYRPDAQLVELVPALQAELLARRVDSRVLDAVEAVPGCDAWLKYRARVEWDTPLLGIGWQPYLSQAQLSLHDRAGRTLASSQFRLEGVLQVGKWGSTREKLAPVLDALLGVGPARPSIEL